ncbi:MAG: cytochrome C oxidase subunit IV family protein [Fimbriimonadales bacterium]
MSDHTHSEEHDDVVHVVPVQTYFLNYAALLVLLVVTVWASRIDFGWANMLIAMGIAAIKTVLVVVFFMHLTAGGKLSKVWALTGIFFFVILIGLTLTDYDSRHMDKTWSPNAASGRPQ